MTLWSLFFEEMLLSTPPTSTARNAAEDCKWDFFLCCTPPGTELDTSKKTGSSNHVLWDIKASINISITWVMVQKSMFDYQMVQSHTLSQLRLLGLKMGTQPAGRCALEQKATRHQVAMLFDTCTKLCRTVSKEMFLRLVTSFLFCTWHQEDLE